MADPVSIPLEKLDYRDQYREPNPRLRHIEELKDPVLREKLREVDPQIVAVYESFAKDGQLNPCIVIQHGETYKMWTGNQRLTAARALGWESLECVVLTDWEKVGSAVKKVYKHKMTWNEELKRFHSSPHAFSMIPLENLEYNSDDGRDYWSQFETKLQDAEWRKENEHLEIVKLYYSLLEEGQLNPVITRDKNKVAIGMQRLACARALGWKAIACYGWPSGIGDVRDVMRACYEIKIRWDGEKLVEESE